MPFAAARLAVTRGHKDLPPGAAPLCAPNVAAISLRALRSALGREISASTSFPAMLWYGGATDAERGFRFKGTVGDFVEHVLVARSREIAPKRTGWVVTPTSNADGHRVNTSTVAMHALNLDTDGTGDWRTLLAVLEAVGLSYIAYQSGGWAPGVEKWHLLLPLHEPFDTTTEERRAAWRAAYHTARAVFGSLGALLDEGFDSRTDPPCVPVFVTERRDLADPPRAVVWRLGRALDLRRLLVGLPPPPPLPAVRSSLPVVELPPLADAHLERLVAGLARAVDDVPHDRRELYLALPGALLERGVTPDDVLAICEAVSERYPRPDHQRHADNVRAARTTIGKFERGEPHTQIGTLVSNWSAVVDVLDEELPREVLDVGKMVSGGIVRVSALAGIPAVPSPTPLLLELPPPSHGGMPAKIRSALRTHARKKLRRQAVADQIRGVILLALVNGEDLTPRMPSGEPASIDGKAVDPRTAVSMAMGMAAYALPLNTGFDAVRIVASTSLHEMREMEGGEDFTKRAERDYLTAVGNRQRQEQTRLESKRRENLSRGF